MVTLLEAHVLVAAHLAALDTPAEDDRWIVLSEKTLERNFGWVFFYHSLAHVETGDPLLSVAGNSPLLVKRGDGSLVILGSAYPVQHYIEKFEQGAKHVPNISINRTRWSAPVISTFGLKLG